MEGGMTETECKILEQAEQLVLLLSSVTARLVRSASATRLTLSQLLPGFEKAYLSHFAEEEPEAEKARQQILEKSAELAGLLRSLGEAK
jgi:hypothetical protein